MLSEVDLRDWGYSPKAPIESKEQYEHYLQHHDWFYDRSDAHNVWLNGEAARAFLLAAQPKFDPDYNRWNFYAPL